jgi:hypothetical protein
LCSVTFAGTPILNEDLKLLASDGAGYDEFGSSVAISGDTLVVGARYGDGIVNYSGSAYFYRFDGIVWQETKLLASDGASVDWFGVSVSISSDGTTALVGASENDDNGSNSGSAYIYELVKGVWQETKLLASDGASDDYFGKSVSLSGDGTTALVGAAFDEDNGASSGSVYIYSLIGGVWQETKLLASDGSSGDNFGISVSLSTDGTAAIVGAWGDNDNGPFSGSAYIFQLVGLGVWEETKLLANDGVSDDNFGIRVSLSSDGTAAIVGANGDDDNGPASGSAYIYRLVKDVWEETKILASDGSSGDYFGASVSISSNGSTALVGSVYDNDNGINSGSVYIFDIDGLDCPDINGDGLIDVSDLLAVIDQWGATISLADVNQDGIVDVSDLLMVVGNWGPCE